MSSDQPSEFDFGQQLQPLVPQIVNALGHPDGVSGSILGPYTIITTDDIASHKILPANELRVDQSLLNDSWMALLSRLSIFDNEQLTKRNPISVLTMQEEQEVRKGLFDLYSAKTHSSITQNPLTPYYMEAAEDLQQLAEAIENSGNNTEEVDGLDPSGSSEWYRCVRGLPLYTPRIVTIPSDPSQTNFILPLAQAPTLEQEPEPFFDSLKEVGLRGIGEHYFVALQDPKAVMQVTEMILSKPKLLRLFLAEQVALQQEDLIHKLRGKITKISVEKLPNIQHGVDDINNVVRVATFRQLDKLLQKHEQIYLSVTPDKQSGDKPLTFGVSKEDDYLIIVWREKIMDGGNQREISPPIIHKCHVKQSANAEELLFRYPSSSNQDWIDIRSPKTPRLGVATQLFQAIQGISQKQFEQADPETIQKVSERLHYLGQDSITPEEFFSELGILGWDEADEFNEENPKHLIVSIEPIEQINL